MKSSELIKILKQEGWYEVKQKGSHIRFRHSDFSYYIIVPNHGAKEVPKGTELTILKQARLR
ncbi:MAG: type II toxin-antitoxin system HicA family toxin [Bacteroidales bacterium]|nr:MAG: type II toxin-antitoxin system HicA family toxin [Bacteroidales bacterium]